MNSAEGLKDEEAGILDEVLQASNQEEVIHKNLRDRIKCYTRAVEIPYKGLFMSVQRSTSKLLFRQFKV